MDERERVLADAARGGDDGALRALVACAKTSSLISCLAHTQVLLHAPGVRLVWDGPIETHPYTRLVCAVSAEIDRRIPPPGRT